MRSPSPLLINVDMTYKQSTPSVVAERGRNGSNLMASPPQTPPDLINSIGNGGGGGGNGMMRKESGATHNHHQHLQQLRETGHGYESPITQLTNKLKSMQLQSPAVVVGSAGVGNGGGGGKSARLIDNGGGGGMVGGRRSGSTSNSSASTATSSATSSPVPHSAASGSYYLNGCGSTAAGRLELGDVSAEDCYEYRHRDYDHDEDENEHEHGGEEDEEEDNVEVRRVIHREQFESTVDEDDDADDDEDNDNDNDDDVDNHSGQRVVRRINKVDLQNIGQAGTTQEFRFGGSNQQNGSVAQSNKSYLPVVPPRTGAKNKAVVAAEQKMRFVPSGGVGGGATAPTMKSKSGSSNGHSAVQELVLVDSGGGEGPNETDVDEVCATTTALLIKQIKEETVRKSGGTAPRDNSQVMVNGDSGGGGGMPVGVVVSNNHSSLHQHNNGNGHTNHNNHSVRHGNISDTTPTTTTSRQREIEKNLINVGKSELKEQLQPTTQSPSSVVVVVAPPPQAAVVVAKKKSWQEEPQTNTMVFNFSKRKDVPDYIESDGLILLPHRKRELPKVTFLPMHFVYGICFEYGWGEIKVPGQGERGKL